MTMASRLLLFFVAVSITGSSATSEPASCTKLIPRSAGVLTQLMYGQHGKCIIREVIPQKIARAHYSRCQVTQGHERAHLCLELEAVSLEFVQTIESKVKTENGFEVTTQLEFKLSQINDISPVGTCVGQLTITPWSTDSGEVFMTADISFVIVLHCSVSGSTITDALTAFVDAFHFKTKRMPVTSLSDISTASFMSYVLRGESWYNRFGFQDLRSQQSSQAKRFWKRFLMTPCVKIFEGPGCMGASADTLSRSLWPVASVGDIFSREDVLPGIHRCFKEFGEDTKDLFVQCVESVIGLHFKQDYRNRVLLTFKYSIGPLYRRTDDAIREASRPSLMLME